MHLLWPVVSNRIGAQGVLIRVYLKQSSKIKGWPSDVVIHHIGRISVIDIPDAMPYDGQIKSELIAKESCFIINYKSAYTSGCIKKKAVHKEVFSLCMYIC